MSKRILVVEDQADNRQIIRDMLAPTDYEISRRSRSVTFISIPAPKGWLALSMPASETGVPKNDRRPHASGRHSTTAGKSG
jgi:CheY-like chemotaxis protein